MCRSEKAVTRLMDLLTLSFEMLCSPGTYVFNFTRCILLSQLKYQLTTAYSIIIAATAHRFDLIIAELI